MKFNKSDPIGGGGGFTLVELLVVIAILGILMGAVIVGINPTARINEATEAAAKQNVAQVAPAMEACITKNLGSESACDTWGELNSGGFVKSATAPSGVTVGAGCVSAAEASSQYCKYTTVSGQVVCDQATGC